MKTIKLVNDDCDGDDNFDDNFDGDHHYSVMAGLIFLILLLSCMMMAYGHMIHF